MQRDLIGYGAHPPDPRWPGGARLAVNFVLNFEEGSEPSVPDGDPASEWGLTENGMLNPGVTGRLQAGSLSACSLTSAAVIRKKVAICRAFGHCRLLPSAAAPLS